MGELKAQQRAIPQEVEMDAPQWAAVPQAQGWRAGRLQFSEEHCQTCGVTRPSVGGATTSAGEAAGAAGTRAARRHEAL